MSKDVYLLVELISVTKVLVNDPHDKLALIKLLRQQILPQVEHDSLDLVSNSFDVIKVHAARFTPITHAEKPHHGSRFEGCQVFQNLKNDL